MRATDFLRLPLARNSPAAVMLLHPDCRVITLSRRRCDKGQRRSLSRRVMRFLDQALAYALPLASGVDSEVGQIATIREVGYGARYADQAAAAIAGGNDQIRIAQHLVEPCEVIDGTPLRQSRSDQDSPKLFRREIRFQGIRNRHELSSAPPVASLSTTNALTLNGCSERGAIYQEINPASIKR